jgi:hypothetical protein
MDEIIKEIDKNIELLKKEIELIHDVCDNMQERILIPNIRNIIKNLTNLEYKKVVIENKCQY